MHVFWVLWLFLAAVLAFLMFNFKPAKIFMGDTGTLFIGFMLGALTLRLTHHLTFELPQNPITSIRHLLAIPLLCGVPIFDTSLATGLRLLHKRPIHLADGSNFTYRLLDLQLSDIEVVLTQYIMQLICTGTALLMALGKSDWWLALGACVYLSAIALAVFLYHRSKMKHPDEPKK